MNEEPDVAANKTAPRLRWSLILSIGIATLAAITGIGALALTTLIPALLFSAADIFAGIPYGLVVLLVNVRWRRQAAEKGGVFGPASVFASTVQIVSFWLKLVVTVLEIWFIVWFLMTPMPLSEHPQRQVLFFVIVLLPAAAAGLITMSAFTQLSRAHLSQLRYAFEVRLPSRHLIRLDRILDWAVWALAVGSLILIALDPNTSDKLSFTAGVHM